MANYYDVGDYAGAENQYAGDWGYLFEIRDIRRAIDAYALDLNYDKWFLCLIQYYKILSPMMKDKHTEYLNAELKTLRDNYRRFKAAQREGRTAIDSAIFDVFDNAEIMLRQVEKDCGLLMKQGNDPHNVVANGRF